jgi:hypothetical protein
MTINREIRNFGDFVASRRYEINSAIYGALNGSDESDETGYVYADGLTIDLVTDPALPRFHLLIENESVVSNDLGELEQKLWAWYHSERMATQKNFFDVTECAMVKLYDKFLEHQLLPSMSANELMWEPTVTEKQKEWLAAFGTLWELAEQWD